MCYDYSTETSFPSYYTSLSPAPRWSSFFLRISRSYGVPDSFTFSSVYTFYFDCDQRWCSYIRIYCAYSPYTYTRLDEEHFMRVSCFLIFSARALRCVASSCLYLLLYVLVYTASYEKLLIRGSEGASLEYGTARSGWVEKYWKQWRDLAFVRRFDEWRSSMAENNTRMC